MEIMICKTEEEASSRAADLVAALVKRNPKAVLGLATSSTPVKISSPASAACRYHGRERTLKWTTSPFSSK